MKPAFLLVNFILTLSLVAPLHETSAAQNDSKADSRSLKTGFQSPPHDFYPETWFHLIGGNVDQKALTTDLEAVASAGISGIQLFHGRGRKWPGVEPQIQTLSPTWDALIGHVAGETERLGLDFTMQNCPGWAMSGGPWITPDKAMRHLISSRQNITGGETVALDLEVPQPSAEPWRDYQDVAVLAFPTPQDDTGEWLSPASVESFPENSLWSNWLAGESVAIPIPVSAEPAHLELIFDQTNTIRSIELPPIEWLMKRRSFDPDSRITISAFVDEGWQTLVTHAVPRGNWQDRLPEMPLVLAVPDAKSKRYRITFHNNQPMEIAYLRLSSTARTQDWRAQAGYALRSLDRKDNVEQDASAWVQRDAVIDLSEYLDASGRLTWEVPAGDWTVVRFGHVNTGVKNKPAPPEATGFECDKLSPAGAEQHFAGYIGRLTKAGGAIDSGAIKDSSATGGRLKGMLIDSWECYTQTWTPAMEKEFQKRRGYALRPWLPALAGWVVDDHQSSERFLRDWRATISDLIAENYYGRLAELGRERGLLLSYETSVGDVSPGDILQYFKSADIPMCEFWQPNDPHEGGLETKPTAPTASAAHIYGKPRIAAEAFTSAPLNWREHPFALKNVADRHFALGVNHLVFHTYTHNPLDRVPGTSFGNSIGAPFLRGQTWWKHMPHFSNYLARCGFLLEQGKPVADVLWYLGDDVDHKPRQNTPFPSGYHFDYLNADALMTRFSVDDGDLVIPEGTRWKVLWLPRAQCRRLMPETMVKIKQLLLDGATVIGEAPILNPSLSGGAKANSRFTEAVNDLWGNAPAVRGDRRIGKGRLLWGDDLKESLAKIGIEPDVSGTLPERWCHRRTSDADIYFVIGSRTHPVDATLHFRAKGTPEFWNPIDGSFQRVAVFKQTEKGTAIPIQLPVAGSTFVVFRSDQATSAINQIKLDGDVLVDASDLTRVDTTAGFPAFGISRYGTIQPWVDPLPLRFCFDCDEEKVIAYEDGFFQFRRDSDENSSTNIAGTKVIPWQQDWTLTFPNGWGAPKSLTLQQVQPWSQLPDNPARHFSGTATYSTSFTLGKQNDDDRIMLDLGRVGNIATIKVNEEEAGVLWSPPYRQDITDFIKQGNNTLTIAVTNTWHNRLAFDSGLSPKKRKTWTISPPKKDALLEFSGLSKDVVLRLGKAIKLIKEDE